MALLFTFNWLRLWDIKAVYKIDNGKIICHRINDT